MRKQRLSIYPFLLPLAALGLLQALPGRERHNPATRPERTIEASLTLSPEVSRILNAACKDCHSHETQWPWYSRIAPASWIVADGVQRARAAMNLSDWPARPRLAIGTLIAACASLQSGQMPPASYLWVHPEARISDDQAAEFCGWTEQESRQLGDQIMHRTLHQPKVSVAALTRAAAPARDR